MAHPKRKTSVSRRNKRRSHDAIKRPTLSIEPATGELHQRHRVSPDGYYRGRKVIDTES